MLLDQLSARPVPGMRGFLQFLQLLLDVRGRISRPRATPGNPFDGFRSVCGRKARARAQFANSGGQVDARHNVDRAGFLQFLQCPC
jgi:hypothetical protein